MSRPELGEGTTVADGAIIGVAHAEDSHPPQIGPNGRIRAGTIIYDNVLAGSGLQTGHHALIREETIIGDDVQVGTQTVVDGSIQIGDSVSMQTGVYIPRETTIGDRAFLGPNATLLNDMYPIRTEYDLQGPTIEDDVSVGANATVLPDLTLGKGAFVAAGAVVVEDVPPGTLAVGTPAEFRELPPELRGGNNL